MRRILLVAAVTWAFGLGCGASRPPPARFNLADHLILAPTLVLSDGDRLNGATAFVWEEQASGSLWAVTTRVVWEGFGDVSLWLDRTDRLELYRFEDPDGSPPAVLTTSPGRIVGGLVLFRLEQPPDVDVQPIGGDLGSGPRSGDALYLVGCREQRAPCRQHLHAVQLTEVEADRLWGRPLDPAHFHVTSGAPLVTADGRVVGVFERVSVGDSARLDFIALAQVPRGLTWVEGEAGRPCHALRKGESRLHCDFASIDRDLSEKREHRGQPG